jgi:glutaredoxin
MDTYYLHSIILEGCPYSTAAHKLLKSFPKIKSKITFVNSNNKENYKTDKINTFPQIYLKRYNKNGSLLIGGYTEFKKLLDLFHTQKYSEANVNKFINDNKDWSKKSILRLIELINK